eukprot:1179363-Prorocentrum_minimum.AAC.1
MRPTSAAPPPPPSSLTATAAQRRACLSSRCKGVRRGSGGGLEACLQDVSGCRCGPSRGDWHSIC